MKKIFSNPEIVISSFSVEDIITASGETPAAMSAVEKLQAKVPANSTVVVKDWNNWDKE